MGAELVPKMQIDQTDVVDCDREKHSKFIKCKCDILDWNGEQIRRLHVHCFG